MIATAAHLEKFNLEQRQAVEHGIEQNGILIGPPLLVIAGAGSGKTKTLASRVAHLIASGADPRRIRRLAGPHPCPREGGALRDRFLNARQRGVTH